MLVSRKLVLADSQCDPKAGVDASTKVVNVEQVVAVVGASCSGATNGMVQSVTIPAGVVSLSDSATAPIPSSPARAPSRTSSRSATRAASVMPSRSA